MTSIPAPNPAPSTTEFNRNTTSPAPVDVERVFGRNSKHVVHGDEATQLSDMVNEPVNFDNIPYQNEILIENISYHGEFN